MGMLLYMMEQQRKSMAASGAKKAPSKPTPIEKPEDKPKVEEKPKKKAEPKITRKDIMKMNVATVRAYAEKQGIKGANAMSGAELKRILGDKLFEESDTE